MVSVQAAIDSLRKAASKCKAKEVKASIENVSSYLIILQSTSAPANVVKKMVTVFRKPLVPIYTAFPALGVQFCAAVYAEIFEAQIKDAVESGSATLADKAQWEMVQHSLLSGVLDFLDETHDPDKNKDLAATAFYPVLCDIHFSLSNDGAISQSNGSLIINVYTFLLESAISHPINQHRLRDPKILGGERIGLTLSRCKDFPAVDILLDIFGMLLPSTGNSESGRAKRTRFIQDVLQPFPSNEDLTKTLGDMQSDQWEVTSRKIIDRLANDDISFPQPFQLDQFSSCGCTFGQEEQDRMYLNDMSFTASVSEDEQLEIFRAHYLRVKNVVFSTPSRASTGVTIYLSSPPVLGPAQIEVTGDQVITLSFALKNKDVGRFQKALEHRGLGDSMSSTQRKLSLHPPVRMEFDRHGKILPELTVEERALTVQRIFDQGSDSIFSTDAPSPEKVRPEKRLPVPVTSPIATKPSLPRPRPVPKGKLSVQQEKTYIDQPLPIVTSTIVTLPRSPLRSLKSPVIALDRSRTAKLTRDVFGASGEELSEVSDDDEPVVPVPVPMVAISPSVPMASLKKHVLSLDHLDDDSDATLFAPPGAVVRRILDSDDEEVLVSARKTKNPSERKKKKMAHAPCTDDEEETEFKPTERLTATGRTALSRAAKENYSEVITPAALVTKDMEVIDKPGPSKMSAISKYPVPVADRPSGPQTTTPATSDKPTISVKRKNNASDTTNDSETDIRSAKRPRQETPNPLPPPQEPVPAATSLFTRASTAFGPRTAKAAASTKKYGKQGRTSSPVPPPSVAHSTGIDYDELPSAYSPPPSDLPDKAPMDLKANVPAVSGRNRISGMKGKAGKANVTVTTIQKGKREKNPPKVAPTPAKTAKPKALATESSKKEKGTKKPDLPAANEPRVTRRSARVATNVIVPKKVDPPPSPEIKRSRASKKPVKAPWEEPDFVSAILPVAAVDEVDDDIVPLEQAPEMSMPIPAAALSDPVVTDDDPIVSYDQISQDQEDHATGAYEDYLVPTKTDPTPDPPSALGSDYVMIDLSKDDDSPAPKKAPTPLRQLKQPVVLLETKKQPPARIPPPDSPVKIQPLKIMPPTPVTLKIEVERPRQSVTFVSLKKAPSVDKVVHPKNYRRPSPVLQPKKTVEFQDIHYPKMYEPENDYDDETTMYDVDDDRKSKARSEMDDIVDVLSQMQEHIVQNISLRFENVDTQVRMGRDMILRDAVADLHRMRSECVIYFNAIVDLEEEHATFRRKVVAGFEDMQNVNEAMSKQLADIIQRHDRHSLSKRLTTSLFSSSSAPLIAINPALL